MQFQKTIKTTTKLKYKTKNNRKNRKKSIKLKHINEMKNKTKIKDF